jgi:hypothetical protein
LNASRAGVAYKAALSQLAARENVTILRSWPSAFHDTSTFWDDTHMLGTATAAFSKSLAQAIRHHHRGPESHAEEAPSSR